MLVVGCSTIALEDVYLFVRAIFSCIVTVQPGSSAANIIDSSIRKTLQQRSKQLTAPDHEYFFRCKAILHQQNIGIPVVVRKAH